MNSNVDRLLKHCDSCGRGGFPVDNAWIAVDLDNTILEEGSYPQFGKPLPDSKDALMLLRKMGFKIMIWTNRTALTDIDGSFQNVNHIMDGMKEHLDMCGIPYDYILPTPHKPALVYKLIDDRAITFKPKEGGWSSVLKEIHEDMIRKNVPVFGDKKPHLKKLLM